LLIQKARENGEFQPVNNDHIFIDTDSPKSIYLTIDHHIGARPPVEPHGRHMAIRWAVKHRREDTYAARSLELIVSVCHLDPAKKLRPFLINWGPRTTVGGLNSGTGLSVFNLGVLTLFQRRSLEAIAWNVGSIEPDGEFNCQNWVAGVLAVAVSKGLFGRATIEEALASAMSHELPSEHHRRISVKCYSYALV
jgi:hypothetical protein